ncbi:MAG TPA: MmcQ/YjbR family DNA-binding protein [Solirubrobacteraceae bacterium]|jgi:hypothetical protein|nr:MmcQ/YjbR family DNA-binding protein [Solirubrobacteraceae bacterium]
MIDWPRVLELARTLPAVEPSYSYGTPALKLRNKLIARLREDGKTLVVRADIDDRDVLIATEPDKFFLTPQYQAHPWVLVRLSRVDAEELRELLTDAWRLRAPRRLAARLDETGEHGVSSRGLRDRVRRVVGRAAAGSGRPAGRRRDDRA